MSEEKEESLTIKLDEGISLIVVVKHPDQEARVMPLSIEEPRSFIEEFRTVWDELGVKVRSEIIRGVVV